MKPRCETCVFWKPSDEEWSPDRGECHYEPPSPVADWPKTLADDFCFHHSAPSDFPDGSKWQETE